MSERGIGERNEGNDGKAGNHKVRMMGMQRIEVGMRGVSVGMLEIGVGMQKIRMRTYA